MQAITIAGKEQVRGPQARARSIPDVLARVGLAIMFLDAAYGVVGGALVAMMWDSNPWVRETGSPLLLFTSATPYLLAMLLGIPCVVGGIRSGLRGHWGEALKGLLPLVGPFAVLFGFMLLSHSLIPCSVDTELPLPLWPPNNLTPWLCAYGGIREQFHILHHTLVGAIPVLGLYWLALRAWKPSVTRWR